MAPALFRGVLWRRFCPSLLTSKLGHLLRERRGRELAQLTKRRCGGGKSKLGGRTPCSIRDNDASRSSSAVIRAALPVHTKASGGPQTNRVACRQVVKNCPDVRQRHALSAGSMAAVATA